MREKLKNYTGRIERQLLLVPSLDQIRKTIQHTNNSCAGPTGLPFSIYRRLIDIYAPIAHGMFLELANGAHAPKAFNEGLLFLLPKSDSGLVTDTRPLSVTNSNNRIIASAAAYALQPALDKMIGHSQIGFLRGHSSDTHIENVTNLYYNKIKQSTPFSFSLTYFFG